MNDYQDTPTVIGSRGANRGTTNAAAIKAAKRSGETKFCLFVTGEILYSRDAAGFSNPGGRAVMWWA